MHALYGYTEFRLQRCCKMKHSTHVLHVYGDSLSGMACAEAASEAVYTLVFLSATPQQQIPEMSLELSPVHAIYSALHLLTVDICRT